MFMAIRICSQNVRGMSDYNERRKIFTYLKNKKVDVLCLQETHSQQKDEKLWKSEWGGTVLYSHGHSNARGVGIFFNPRTHCELLSSSSDPEGRFVVCTIKCQSRFFVLSSVYGPNHDSPEFFVTVFQHLSRTPFSEWIIGGDFNVVLDAKLDKRTQVSNCILKKATLTLKELMSQHEMCDIWRQLNPDRRRYSWHGRVKFASRIDFFIITQSLAASVQRCEYLATPLSDHSAVLMDLNFKEIKHGKGFWKFNETLLNDKNFKTRIEESIEAVLVKNSVEKLDPILNWEMIKLEVVG